MFGRVTARDGGAVALPWARWRGARPGPRTTSFVDHLSALDDPNFRADPYPFYDAFRARGALATNRRNSIWVTADHATSVALLRDPRFRVSAPGQRPDETRSPLSPSLLDLNPPDHTRIRRLASPAFSPRVIEELREPTRRIADDLLAEAGRSGSMDLMTGFAAPLPIRVICHVLGIPAADIDRFRRWGTVVGQGLDGARSPREQRRVQSAARQLASYFRQLFDDHRRTPRSDLLQVLLDAHEDEEHLSERELIATCSLLLIAGFETTVNVIGNGTLALLNNPDEWRLLVEDRTLIANGVEELMRYDAPVQLTGRVADEPVNIDEFCLDAGDTVGIFLGGANRDPAVFPEPNTVDVTRTNARDHVSFSGGIHYCLGSYLARLEAQVAFEALTERCPDLRLDGAVVRRPTRILRGLAHLPVRWA